MIVLGTVSIVKLLIIFSECAQNSDMSGRYNHCVTITVYLDCNIETGKDLCKQGY